MSEPLTFIASIAPLQSAITIAHDGGARVKIDIPESEMPAIVRLMLMRGRALKITIEPMAEKKKQTDPEWGDDDDNESGDTG